MRTATLRSHPSTDHGTFGIIETDSGVQVVSGELPARDNKRDISCISPDADLTFTVRDMWSNRFQAVVWHIQDVPGREAEELHAANFMGDISLGFVSQLLGCIAPGAAVTRFKAGFSYSEHHPPLFQDQIGISSSGPALAVLRRDLGPEFRLSIMRNALPPLDLTKL